MAFSCIFYKLNKERRHEMNRQSRRPIPNHSRSGQPNSSTHHNTTNTALTVQRYNNVIRHQNINNESKAPHIQIDMKPTDERINLDFKLGCSSPEIRIYTCSVCLTNRRDTILYPCGHVFCLTCIQQIHNKSCPLCRKQFKTYYKVFI
jgi:rubrerythrin